MDRKSDAVLVDALPYIDREYDDPDVQTKVHNLIEDEMTRLTPSDYLGMTGLKEYELSFKEGSILRNEYLRVLRNLPMQDLDRERYTVSAPAADRRGDVEEWERACSNAKAQLQHQLNRSANLDLLTTYGTNAWLHSNKLLDGMERSMKVTAKRLRSEVESVNAQRQRAQNDVQPTLWNLSVSRMQLAEKNLQLEVVNAALREEIKKFRVNNGS